MFCYQKNFSNPTLPVDEAQFYALVRATQWKENIDKFRKTGDASLKRKLPAFIFQATFDETTSKKGITGAWRKQAATRLTGLVVMDVDHLESEELRIKSEELKVKSEGLGILLAYITPSGKGLKIVFKARTEWGNLIDNQHQMAKLLGVEVDESCKDASRMSFICKEEDILYIDKELFTYENKEYGEKFDEEYRNGHSAASRNDLNGNQNENENQNYQPSEVDERIRFIAKGVMKEKGLLENDFIDEGGRHTTVKMFLSGATQLLKKEETNGVLKELMPEHWNDDNIQQLVEDFYQNYTNPNQRLLRYQENLFTQSRRLGKEKDENVNDNEDENDYDDEEENQKDEVAAMPPAPPVIRELISIAPKDFVIPSINALMPILGTLTSYVRAEDKQDNKTISTTFFSIIYAPPSSGKSFVERYINYLMRDLFRRDELNDARDEVYSRADQQRSQSEHGEALPMTTIRVMEAKCSETEFLQKQRNNRGHHMFTYCSEIDQWRKGIKSAGGNKDDMIRIAWDNGRYGQKYKSTNSFKGKVFLYWNLLIAGTDDQLQAYFKNVTNGLVTRCCFQEIKNQEFQEVPPEWKNLSKKDRKVIDSFIEKCDRMTYTKPLTYDVEQCYSVPDKEFDAEVPWQMDFKPMITADIDWILPTIARFNREQCRRAMIDNDKARDVFRRRVGTRAKRLALLCTQLYEKPMTQADKRACAKWIAWWMEQDIKGIMVPFGNKYTKAIEVCAPDNTPRRTLFERLPEEFSKDDIRRAADILGYSSPVKQIVTNWIKINVIEKLAKNRWRKMTNK